MHTSYFGRRLNEYSTIPNTLCGYNITFTGHSLGGAIAALTAARTAMQGPDEAGYKDKVLHNRTAEKRRRIQFNLLVIPEKNCFLEHIQ
ncbi:unnamed protein product [Angiostrongylus costaricensis]|uniref:Lipase_3 domain-containing protein n=1 Tax=Angiostrongylus costaricensis TaxID=334426 RepID=A0A0R3Q0K3_ANGCS|nr:unnamed protein product [Angiostrongylus costaricensis]